MSSQDELGEKPSRVSPVEQCTILSNVCIAFSKKKMKTKKVFKTETIKKRLL